MIKTTILGWSAALGLLTLHCGGPEDAISEANTATLGAEGAALRPAIERLRLKDLQTGTTIPWSGARLARRSRGVSVVGWTTKLPKRTDVSLIWAIFNHPELCTFGNPVTGAPCGPQDLSIDDVGGHISALRDTNTRRAGVVLFRDRLRVSDVSACIEGLPCREGLTEPKTAEVHVVILDAASGDSLQGAQFIP